MANTVDKAVLDLVAQVTGAEQVEQLRQRLEAVEKAYRDQVAAAAKAGQSNQQIADSTRDSAEAVIRLSPRDRGLHDRAEGFRAGDGWHVRRSRPGRRLSPEAPRRHGGAYLGRIE